ncbi:MAG TPA: hypothetical protein VJK51_03845 [Candidatus Nanoarchaeia archaeon]|nr:hypothetical protein [Candidatus Nanoarchaeia archaeon]
MDYSDEDRENLIGRYSWLTGSDVQDKTAHIIQAVSDCETPDGSEAPFYYYHCGEMQEGYWMDGRMELKDSFDRNEPIKDKAALCSLCEQLWRGRR